MTVAVYPGSFDPLHNGHLDVISRAARHLDELVVAVVDNPNKQGLFTIDERVAQVEAATSHVDGVRVDRFSGLLVDWCAEHDVQLMVKGLRTVEDFEYEARMARMNDHLADVETMFLVTDPGWSHVSSSLVKEVARLGGDVAALVPDVVLDPMLDRLAEA